MGDDAQPGLYDPGQERDSCGFGLIAQLDNQSSRWVVDTALASLARMAHRGAIGADGKTGDGCGVLLHRPETFLRHVAAFEHRSILSRRAAIVSPAAPIVGMVVSEAESPAVSPPPKPET